MSKRLHFGAWLKREIARREKTITAFAQETGISAARIWGLIETSAPGIRGDNIARLARGLGVTYEEIEAKLQQARGIERATAAA